MDYKMTEILIRLAHISELLKTLSTEIDRMYNAITDQVEKK